MPQQVREPIEPMASHQQDPLALLKIRPNYEPPQQFDERQMTPAALAAWTRFAQKFPDASRAVAGLRVNAALRQRQVDGWATPDHAIELNPDVASVDTPELEALIAHEAVHLIRPDNEKLARQIETNYPRGGVGPVPPAPATMAPMASHAPSANLSDLIRSAIVSKLGERR